MRVSGDNGLLSVEFCQKSISRAQYDTLKQLDENQQLYGRQFSQYEFYHPKTEAYRGRMTDIAKVPREIKVV